MALAVLGQRESGTARLKDAVAPMMEPYRVHFGRADYFVQVCRANRGRALALIAPRERLDPSSMLQQSTAHHPARASH